jgi:hypothetical protein
MPGLSYHYSTDPLFAGCEDPDPPPGPIDLDPDPPGPAQDRPGCPRNDARATGGRLPHLRITRAEAALYAAYARDRRTRRK